MITFFLLLQDLEDMDLHDYEYKFRDTMTIDSIKFISRQILLGCDYLHGNYIMHRDLKPNNVLINETTKVIKLSDFGCARTFVLGRRGLAQYSWPIQVLPFSKIRSNLISSYLIIFDDYHPWGNVTVSLSCVISSENAMY
jgi:serine/threonine protein kinase